MIQASMNKTKPKATLILLLVLVLALVRVFDGLEPKRNSSGLNPRGIFRARDPHWHLPQIRPGPQHMHFPNHATNRSSDRAGLAPCQELQQPAEVQALHQELQHERRRRRGQHKGGHRGLGPPGVHEHREARDTG